MVRRKVVTAQASDRTVGMAWSEFSGDLATEIWKITGIQVATAVDFWDDGRCFFPDAVFQQFSLGYAAGRTDKGVFLSGLSDNGSVCGLFLFAEDAYARTTGVSGSAKRDFGTRLPEDV